MTLDVVVPAVRRATIDRLLRSLALGSEAPNVVSIVTNEVPRNVETHGLNVRLLRFRSSSYPIGDCDVALRRDVGIWQSECSHVLTLDDDVIAPADLVRVSRKVLSREPYFWGHYRYASPLDHSVESLSTMPPERGRAREHPPNSWHSWMSCYGGLFGGETARVKDCGGFDLIYSCRHANEDQEFGRRLAHLVHRRERIFVYEPPFVWHPSESEPWEQVEYSNLCDGAHCRITSTMGETPVERCTECPYLRAKGGLEGLRARPLWPYDPSEVAVMCEEPL